MTAERKDMAIKIIHVEVAEVPKKSGPGSNKAMSVTYENLTFNGKVEGKKMQDWATPKPVWDTLLAAKHGEIFNIEYQKNERGFNDWLEVVPGSAVEVVKTAIQPKAKTPSAIREAKGEKVAGTWDEKNKLDRERYEFDKVKQGLIIRQSCLSTAVAMHAATGKAISPKDVVATAQYFEQYVLAPEEETTTAPDTEAFPE
jgi:hypothetical protein